MTLPSWQKIKEKLTPFFEGYAYPVLVAAMVLLGHRTGFEFYINLINCLLFLLALSVCDTVRPIIPFALTFVYQVSVVNSPAAPTLSKYYFTGIRLPLLLLLAVLLLAGIIYYVLRTELWRSVSLRTTPLLLPLLLLAAVFLYSNLTSKKYFFGNLLFSIIQIFSFVIIFLLFYHGLEKEDPKKIFDYFCYVSTIVSLLLIAELALLYLDGDVINDQGQIEKTKIFTGWGVSTSIGAVLSILIPINFYRALKGPARIFHFAVATLLLVASACSMSRNALLFGAIAYAVCLIIACVYSEYKRLFRIGSGVLFAVTLVLLLVFHADIIRLFNEYFALGFHNDGRFAIWRNAIWAFKKSPIFGVGFFIDALQLLNNYGISLFPVMIHNTPLQFLASCGLIGLLFYLVYRIMTLRPFLRHPSFEKTFLGITILVFLAESLLDVFVFTVYPLIYYNIALAIAHHLAREDERLAARKPLSDRTKSIPISSGTTLTLDLSVSEDAKTTELSVKVSSDKEDPRT